MLLKFAPSLCSELIIYLNMSKYKYNTIQICYQDSFWLSFVIILRFTFIYSYLFFSTKITWGIKIRVLLNDFALK